MRQLILIAALACMGCGSGPTAPTPAPPTSTPAQTLNVSGTWRGTYASAQIGYGRATIVLTQTGTSLSGTWSTTPDVGGGSSIGAGTLSGALSAPSSSIARPIALTFTPSDPRTCPFQFTGSASTSSGIFGQFVSTNCTVTASGSLILDR